MVIPRDEESESWKETIHLLRNPASKKEAWIDFQAIRDAYREVLAEQERSGEILT